MARALLSLCLIPLYLATGTLSLSDSSVSLSSAKINVHLQAVLSTLQRFYPQVSWKMVGVMVTLCSLVPGFWWIRNGKLLSSSAAKAEGTEGAIMRHTVETTDAEPTDPGLLRKYSEFKSYTTSRATYPKLRIFYRKHPQAEKLPKEPAPLPLLVFIHGLGGSVAQFHALLNTMVNISSCLAVDLPGCGMSKFSPTSWDAYKTEALVSLLEIVIEDYREKDANQGVCLIGHSMGASLAARLATKNLSYAIPLSEHVVGMVAICPKAEPPSEEQVSTFRKLLWVPNPVFDLWRQWDRRGGFESPSVRRFVGAGASQECKKLQFRFNEQSKTAVWRRMAWGSLPIFDHGIPKDGLPGKEVWAGLDVPVFLVGGEMDNITPPTELAKIAVFLGKSHPDQIEIDKDSQPINDAAAPVSISSASDELPPRQIDSTRREDFIETDPDSAESHDDPSTPNEELSAIPPQPWKPKKILKRIVLPAPATHALLYQPTEVRVLAGLISDFLSSQVSQRLALGWQLQFLTQNSKWDVKNLAKWEKVNPVSEPIGGTFRAMKTLREVDPIHCPQVFVKNWGSSIKDVIDISHDNPVYDSRALERGGIHYHKFPTISKIPPTGDEVDGFIALVDRLREEQKGRTVTEGWGEHYIGVHCHYGFNRTGYFVVCYLVEKMGYDVQSAIDEFAKKRPNGIKHAHFIDGLFVRYCKGLKRAPTI